MTGVTIRRIFKRRSLRIDEEAKYMNLDWDRDRSFSGAWDKETEFVDYDDARTVSSFSTNATMDDIPGPGRILDKCIYQYFGRKVERLAFRLSISYLHPNKICQYLWVNNENCMPYGSRNPRPLGEVINNIYEFEGSACVSGLKSLVKQAQYVNLAKRICRRLMPFYVRSSSIYRSAAALVALIRLSTSLSTFSDFYVAVTSIEPLYRLESLARALENSHPKKTYFLCLTTLARVRLQFTSNFEIFGPSVDDYKQLESSPEYARTFQRNLLEVLDSLRCVLRTPVRVSS